MSFVIQCDGCKCVIPSGELQFVVVDATIKDNPDRVHICSKCAKHMARFIGDLTAFNSGGIPEPDIGYIQGYLDSVREGLRDGGNGEEGNQS